MLKEQASLHSHHIDSIASAWRVAPANTGHSLQANRERHTHARGLRKPALSCITYAAVSAVPLPGSSRGLGPKAGIPDTTFRLTPETEVSRVRTPDLAVGRAVISDDCNPIVSGGDPGGVASRHRGRLVVCMRHGAVLPELMLPWQSGLSPLPDPAPQAANRSDCPDL